MEYVQLGKSDLKVSKICWGCMSFGEKKQILGLDFRPRKNWWNHKKTLYLGINFFDTANCYANGTIEVFIGNSFKKFVKHRKDIVVPTKVRWNEVQL